MNDHWNTPESILAPIREYLGPIALDPCGNPGSTVGALREYRLDRGEDGLKLPWAKQGLNFVNYPYSRDLARAFARKAWVEACGGAEVLLLGPANVETRPWQDSLWTANAFCFPKRRIRFLLGGKEQGSPRFASALVYFGQRTYEFVTAFRKMGRIILNDDTGEV